MFFLGDLRCNDCYVLKCTVDTANQQFKTQKNYGAKKEIASHTVNITKQQKKGY